MEFKLGTLTVVYINNFQTLNYFLLNSKYKYFVLLIQSISNNHFYVFPGDRSLFLSFPCNNAVPTDIITLVYSSKCKNFQCNFQICNSLLLNNYI